MRHASLAAIGLLILACTPGTPRISPPTSENVQFERGLQLFPSPRENDAPGTIFRIDREGVRHTVVDLSGMLALTPQVELVPTVTLGDRFRWRALAKFVRDSVALSDSTRDSIIVAASGTRRERSTDVTLKPVIDSALMVVEWRERNRYFIITETILADSLKYVFDSQAALDLGGAGTISRIVKASANLSWSSSGPRYELAARFDRPLRVFYKTQRLTPKGAALGGSVKAVSQDSVFERIGWSRETTGADHRTP